MEFLSAIATAIVGKIAEYTVGPVVRQISYVTGCEDNLQKLKAAVENLKAARESVANEVGEAERRGERIQPDVQLWLKKVDEVTAKTDQFSHDDRPTELKCFHAGVLCNLKNRHQISRKSTKLLPEVVQLDENRGFSTVSCGILRQEVFGVSTRVYQAFASRMSTVKKIMDELKNPNIQRIGVYGIGGVGKTTLAKQVYKQATEDEKNLFDDVVLLLDVKENPDMEEIQKKIVEKLGMDILDSETTDGRASRLCARIKGKKTLVILDDVWEEIKLEAVGIPSVATCKILLTSRSRTALSDMSTDKDFALDILEEEETWVLFENKAGDVVKDPAIRTVATQVAKYCRGLPVLVVTVASTLKRRTSLPPWEDALRCLQEGSNSEKLTEKAYLGLEWSYSQLKDKELQQLFLLCGITMRRNEIILTDLLRYAMGLGILGQVSTIKAARNKMHSLIDELKDFCLLIDTDDREDLTMHDLVRDVVNRIALRDHYIFSSVLDGGGRELKEWADKDFLEKCTIISLPCGNNISRLPKVLQCQALKMLLLQGDRYDDSLTSLPTFFEEMKQLNVLALENMCIPSLPSSFQSLKNVQTLCLEQCKLGDITLVGELSNLEILSFAHSVFEQLPKEIAQLTHLRLLDLSNCWTLRVIPFGVISSLTSLEDLRMNLFDRWEVEGKGSNASLSELKNLSRLTALQISISDANTLPANLFSSLELERYQLVIGRCALWFNGIGCDFGYDGTLNALKITESIQLDKGLKMLLKKTHQLFLAGTFGFKNTLDHQLDTKDFKQVVFPSLTTMGVTECNGLRFLFSSSMARSLKELKFFEVDSCEIMEEIVLSTRGEDSEENMVNLFPKLQSVRLKYLPKLVRFCISSYIEFSSLEELELISCDELESFICDPLNSGEKDREETTLQYSLFNEKVVFPSLTTLRVDECDGIRFLFSSSVARSLVELKDLVIKSCKNMEEIVLSTRGEDGAENMENLFPKLQSLRLESLPKLVRFCTSSYIEFSSLEELELSSCDELESFICDPLNSGEKDREETTLQYSLFNEKVVFPSLTTLRVDECDGIRFLFSSSVARSLKELKFFEVDSCEIMEEIVLSTRGEDSEENMVNLFPKLQSVRLKYLPKLVRFCISSYIEFSSLEELELRSCDELESFICDPLNSGEKDREETALQYSLFNEKVGCRSLERLKIEGLIKLKTIWQNQLVAHQDSFCRLRNIDVSDCDHLINMFLPSIMGRLNALETIEICWCKSLEVVFEVMRGPVDDVKAEIAHVDTSSSKPWYCPNLYSVKIWNCDSLQHIFPVAVARGLEQLHELEVNTCKKLEVIIGEEAERVIENPPHELVFPNVSSLELYCLPQLKSFYTVGMHTSKWPSLKQLKLYGDVPHKVFASQVSLFRERHYRMEPETSGQPFFLIEKDSFPQLEELTLGNHLMDPSLTDLFPKLKSFCFYEWAPFSNQAALLFLDKSPNLERIEVQLDESDEIFVGEMYALPRVRFLTLSLMGKLLNLGNQEKSQSAAAASPVPNLQFLELDGCQGLNSLDQSSAIPFRNLTTLIVRNCQGLKYLISYSVAKSLVQLETMKVEYCDNIEVIIDDDAAASHEIVNFNCTWKYVKLHRLPRLQEFSSGKCIVKLPSLETFEVDYDINLKIGAVKFQTGHGTRTRTIDA